MVGNPDIDPFGVDLESTLARYKAKLYVAKFSMRVVVFVTLLCASTFGERYSDMSCLVVFDARNCRCKALQKPEPRFCRSSVGTTKVCWTYATLRSANPTAFRSHASSSSASSVSSDASSMCAPDGAWANLMGRCSC
jgi:hypothetical protein